MSERTIGSVSPSRRYRTEFDGPSLGTEQECHGGVKAQRSAKGTDLLADVFYQGTIIAQVTTDMGTADENASQRESTIEIKTAPTEIDDDDGWNARVKVIDLLANLILKLSASDEAKLKNSHLQDGGYTLNVVQQHKFTALPGATLRSFANQATLGVKCIDIGTDRGSAGLLKKASWFNTTHGFTGITDPTSRALYSFVLSAMYKFATLIEEEKLAIEGLPDAYKNYAFSPTIKDSWKILPRTPVIDTLNCLTADERRKVRAALNAAQPPATPPAQLSAAVWRAAKSYLLAGGKLAGHDQHAPTIQREPGALFEFRDDIPPEFNHAFCGSIASSASTPPQSGIDADLRSALQARKAQYSPDDEDDDEGGDTP